LLLDRIDLAWKDSNPGSIYLRQIGDSLTLTDGSGGLQPMLAESWKNVDPTTWEFKLRQGVKFHNGKELQGEDVKWSVERVLDPKANLPTLLNVLQNIDH